MSVIHPSKANAFYAILANAIPIYGVLFLDWSVFLLFILFWFENVAIGFFTLAQILAFGLKRIIIDRDNPISFIGILFVAAFFTVHYGMFTFGHGTMIFAILDEETRNNNAILSLQYIVSRFLEEHLLWAALAIICAAGLSAVRQFSNHTTSLDARTIMFAPYGRIIILHVGLLLGGMAALALGEPIWALLLLISLKSAYDLISFEIKLKSKATQTI